jgi:alcohol/geraniol dehydrogenase (NADP+)
MSSYEIIGERACVPCDIGDAHGVAIIADSPGLETHLLPFRHPPLLDKEVRIKITNSGLCQSDTMMMQNSWGLTHYPFVGGHENLGIVTHVGEKVTNLQVGDRVGHGPIKSCCENCFQCFSGYTNLCPKAELTVGLAFGGWATSFQSDAKSFVKISEQVPGSAAPLFCAGLTAFAPMKADVVPGMKVGVIGIGGLGHLGIMIANKLGCEVTAISTSPSKEQEAKELGAHKFINSKDPEELEKNQNSLDYILNTATGHNFDIDFGLLKPGGVVNVVGAPDFKIPTQFSFGTLISKQLTIKASAAGSRLDMQALVDFCTFHSIYPKSEIYALTEAKSAIASLASGIPRAPRYRAVFETSSFFESFTPTN